MEMLRGLVEAFRRPPRFQREVRQQQPVERRVDWERRRVIDMHREIDLRLTLLKHEAGLMGHWGHRPPEREDPRG